MDSVSIPMLEEESNSKNHYGEKEKEKLAYGRSGNLVNNFKSTYSKEINFDLFVLFEQLKKVRSRKQAEIVIIQ